jgi:hypothetical protein
MSHIDTSLRSGRRKVAFLCSSLPGGAIQQVFITLANAMSEHGSSVDLVAPRIDSWVDAAGPDVRIVDLNARATRVPWISSKRRR